MVSYNATSLSHYLSYSVCYVLPEDDILHVKGVFYDTGGWYSDSEDILQVRYIRGLCNSIEIGEIAEKKEKKISSRRRKIKGKKTDLGGFCGC